MKSISSQNFLELAISTEPVDAVVAGFSDAIAEFGFSVCAGGGFVGPTNKNTSRYFFNTWPLDWLEIYENEGLAEDDPVVIEARRRNIPFSWGDLEQNENFTRLGARVVKRGYDYGWRQVFVVPVHGAFGYFGLVTMASKEKAEIDAMDRIILRSMAIAVHDRCHKSNQPNPTGAALTDISPREIEIMKWVAVGKTDSEIGQIIDRSKSTAHFHIEQVKKKLKVHSRTEAIALLALFGII